MEGCYGCHNLKSTVWLVVPTPLKNINQLGILFQTYGKTKKKFQTTNQVYFVGVVSNEIYFQRRLVCRKGPIFRCTPGARSHPNSCYEDSAPARILQEGLFPGTIVKYQLCVVLCIHHNDHFDSKIRYNKI